MEYQTVTTRKVFWLSYLIPPLILLIILIPFKQVLVFEYGNTNKHIAYISINREKTFQIKYTHSIHLSDVVESYKITNSSEIKLYELMYDDFAVGMPANAEKGESFEQKNGKYYIKNMNRIFPFFDLRLGQVKANHRIIYNKKVYSLVQFIKPGTLVRVQIKKINLLQQMKGVNILES